MQRSTQVAITAAVVGMGGVGKSELALQYAREHLRTYPGGVCFLAANDFAVDLVRFARRLFFPNVSLEDFSLAEQVAYCWQHWAEGEVLLVIDDVTDYGQVKPYLPEPTRFKVLMTTRRQLGKPVQLLRLDVLDEVAALDLLKFLTDVARIEGELEDAKQLCRRLGYLPLALELVGRYLSDSQRCSLPLKVMLSRLEAKGLRHTSLEEAKSEMTAERGVRAAFELSWEALNDNFKAQQLGCFLSLFALAAIPWVLVEFAAPEEEAEELEDARVALEELHLLQAAGEEIYLLHQLIREFFREKLEGFAQADEMKHAFAAVMVAEAKKIPQQPTLELIESLKPAIPHLEELASQLTNWLSDEDLIMLFTGLGLFYQGQGFYQLAEPWLEKCTEVAKSLLSADHPDVATSLNNLALLYYSQGRYSDAKPLWKQALGINKRSLPYNHPRLALSLNNLAALYYSQGCYSKAEPLYQKALYILRHSLPYNHPQLAVSLNNLAAVYKSLGQYRRAKYLLLRALVIDCRSLPKDHPQLALHLNNLAELYKSLGQNENVESLYLQAIEINHRSLPPNHPQLNLPLNNLAYFYKSQGDYGKAKLLYQKALKINRRSLPRDHPEIAIDLNNLAELYRAQGDYSKAKLLYQKALKISRRSLPRDHPQLATHLNNLALLYYSQGDYGKVEPLLLQALEIFQRSLPENHPDIVGTWQNLALFWVSAISEGRASLEQLRDHPLGAQLWAQIQVLEQES
ncbi:MAG: tetratricopeptide repeat protein [Kastovskya adunca ATA6-11-RM4]|nr:tetratricopeptide repeat protein [Kastovskya adunca ATA6-11-RM4]